MQRTRRRSRRLSSAVDRSRDVAGQSMTSNTARVGITRVAAVADADVNYAVRSNWTAALSLLEEEDFAWTGVRCLELILFEARCYLY